MICQKHDMMLEFRPYDGGGQGEYFCPECRKSAQEIFAKLCRETPLPHGLDHEGNNPVDFAEITRNLDAIAEKVADLAGANEGERRIIREVSRLTRHGHKTMDLTFRKDGKEYRFEADWVARLFVSHSKVKP